MALTGRSQTAKEGSPTASIVQETAQGGLYLRQSSGLVREIGARETFAIAASIILFIAAFTNDASGLATTTGGDYYIPVLIAGLVSAVVLLMYAQLLCTMPRSGGDYVYASRVAGPVVGAAIGGFVMLAMMLNCGNVAVAWGQLLMPFLFETAGAALHIHAMTSFASTMSTKTGFFVTGSLFILVVSCVAIRPVHVATRAIFWAFVVSFIGFLIIAAELLLHSRTQFISAFNATSSSHAYSLILADARHAGMRTGVTLSGLVGIYAFAYLYFGGFTVGVLAGGEIKRPSRTYVSAMLAALGLGVVCGLVAWAAVRHAAGLAFLQSAPWLSNHAPKTYGTVTSSNALLGGVAYAGMLAGDPITKLSIPLGLGAAYFAILLSYILLTSRVIFALAFDRLLPSRMTAVDKRTHAPLYALALTLVGVLAFNAFGSFTSLLTIFRNIVLVLFALFTFSSLVGVLLPFRRRELFANAPKVVHGRWRGIPAAAVIAAGSCIGNGIATYLIATKPAINGGYSVTSITTLVVIGLSGLVLYGVSRLYLRRRGIDINLVMHELPPE